MSLVDVHNTVVRARQRLKWAVEDGPAGEETTDEIERAIEHLEKAESNVEDEIMGGEN